MLLALVVLLWISMVVSMILMNREARNREELLRQDVDILKDEIEKMKREAPLDDKVRRVNAMATSLLTVLQEKEDDIQALLDVVEQKRSESNVEVLRHEPITKEEDEQYGNLSLSERHTLNLLKKRRLG